MTVRLVIDISSTAMTDEHLVAELLHNQPLAIVTCDGIQLDADVVPVAVAHSHELDNSADVTRAAEQRLGLPGTKRGSADG
jgi:hypothetical protein